MAKQSAQAGRRPQPGRLRIVAGNWRSRLLQIADVPGLRPTPERVRETLFNWLAPRLPGARCLDLFAGTGALGLEALSRGAASAVFVESSPVAVAMLRRNIGTLGAAGASVRETDACEFLGRPGSGTFDLVFLDPPFAGDRLAELCRLLSDSGMLANDACVYLEEARARPETVLPEGWRLGRQKEAGSVRFALAETATTTA